MKIRLWEIYKKKSAEAIFEAKNIDDVFERGVKIIIAFAFFRVLIPIGVLCGALIDLFFLIDRIVPFMTERPLYIWIFPIITILWIVYEIIIHIGDRGG